MYGKFQIEYVWEPVFGNTEYRLGHFVLTLGNRSIMVKKPEDVTRIVHSYLTVVPNIRKHFTKLREMIKQKHGIEVTENVDEFIDNHVLIDKKEGQFLVTSFSVNQQLVYDFKVEGITPVLQSKDCNA